MSDALPALFGRALAWLPPDARVRPREGVFAARVRTPTVTPARSPGIDDLVRYLGISLAPPPGLEAHALAVWELLGSTEEELFALFAELAPLAEAWDRAADLETYLRARWLTPDEIAACDRTAPAPLFGRDADAGELWNRVVHYWGRGFLPVAVDKLARLLAYRVIVDHLVHLDAPDAVDLPHRYLRRLRWEALLPRERAGVMLAALSEKIPSVMT